MRHLRLIAASVGLLAVVAASGDTQAGPWRRQRWQGYYANPQGYASGPFVYYPARPAYGVGIPGSQVYRPRRESPSATNGWGYGLPAAGYGSSYPAHPLGPGPALYP